MIDKLIRERRSIRKYSAEIIPDEDIKAIIEAGMWAPTACNKQDYRFIYISDHENVMKLFNLGSAHFLRQCNQAILVLYYNQIDNCEYHDDVLSAGMVIQNMLLKATELKIATCTIANLPSKNKLRKKYKIPYYYDPIALVSLGYGVTTPTVMKRKFDVEDVVHYNEFDSQKDKRNKSSKVKLVVRKYLRMVYIRMPKTDLLRKLVDCLEKKFEN